jgi:hypothetical protein
MGDLSEEMKLKLEEWRKNNLPLKLKAVKRIRKQNVFVSRKDFGDDIESMRSKDESDS